MSEFAPPTGPPPPKVPEGWKAIWNEQYSEWFYVNTYTKQSTWERPTEPVYPPGEHPPPSYIPGQNTGATEKSNLSSNNPYAAQGNMSEDEKFARKLQEEEEARARGHGAGVAGAGASNDYYGQPGQNQYGAPGAGSQYGAPAGAYQQDGAHSQASKSKGLLGKLKDKVSGASGSSHGGHGYGPPMGAPGGYYQQSGHGGMMGGGRPMGGGMMPMGGGGMMGGGRRPGGGMGPGGAMALGAGGGLLGGAMLGSALGDAGDGGDTYINNDYGDDGGMGGGDMGDMGGGDMGDMGGGDF